MQCHVGKLKFALSLTDPSILCKPVLCLGWRSICSCLGCHVCWFFNLEVFLDSSCQTQCDPPTFPSSGTCVDVADECNQRCFQHIRSDFGCHRLAFSFSRIVLRRVCPFECLPLGSSYLSCYTCILLCELKRWYSLLKHSWICSVCFAQLGHINLDLHNYIRLRILQDPRTFLNLSGPQFCWHWQMCYFTSIANIQNLLTTTRIWAYGHNSAPQARI